MPFNYHRALVTGGAGFIGSHLVEALVEKGCRVTVIDDLSSGRLSNLDRVRDRIRFIQGGIRNGGLLDEAVSGCEVVFHLAAVVSVVKTVDDPIFSAKVNEMGTLEVLEAARRHQVTKVVLSSSSAVYGDIPGVPKSEDMAVYPQSPYAVQKLAGEWYARLYHHLYRIPAVSLRYFNVYGPRQDPSSPYSGVISIFMARAAAGVAPTVYGDGGQYRDFVFVRDVVAANLLAAASDQVSGEALNIGTGVPTTINALWKKIENLAGITVPPVHADERPGEIRESVADIGRAGEKLAFRPAFALDAGLAATFAWYREAAAAAGGSPRDIEARSPLADPDAGGFRTEDDVENDR